MLQRRREREVESWTPIFLNSAKHRSWDFWRRAERRLEATLQCLLRQTRGGRKEKAAAFTIWFCRSRGCCFLLSRALELLALLGKALLENVYCSGKKGTLWKDFAEMPLLMLLGSINTEKRHDKKGNLFHQRFWMSWDRQRLCLGSINDFFFMRSYINGFQHYSNGKIDKSSFIDDSCQESTIV